MEEDASNLLEFLLTLLSQDRQSYDAIVGRLRSIVPEVMDVATPLVHEGQEVYGIIRDAAHPGVEIDWNEVSSGTKQILQILGFATRAPVLLVEEPELSLHPDAVVQLMKILQSLAAAAGTQLVCSTHSPALIDSLGFGQIRVVSRPRDGPSEVHDMGDFAAVEKKMRTFGLSLGPLLASSGVDQAYPRFLLVVEGRDDRLIWPKLLERGGVEDLSVSIVNGNGWQDACAITRFLGFLKMIGVHSVDHLLVVDSDGDAEKRRGELLSLGLGDDEFVVLKEKELESYLLDEVALSAVTGKAVDDVAAAVKGAKGRGKEKLQEVLRTLGIASMDPGIMQAVVQQMPQLPEDLAEVVQRVKANVAE